MAFFLHVSFFVIQDIAMVSEHLTASVKDVGDTEEPVRCLVWLLCCSFWGLLFLVWLCVFLIPIDNWLKLKQFNTMPVTMEFDLPATFLLPA